MLSPRTRKWLTVLQNRYIFSTVLLVVYVLFFDSNDMISQIGLRYDIYTARKDAEHYRHEIEEVERQINELTTSTVKLEKFAREQYHMKREDEVVFVLIDDGHEISESGKSVD